MNKITVSENKLLVNNKELFLRGVAIEDPVKMKKRSNIHVVFKLLKKLNVQILRIPILPGNYKFYENYLEQYLDPWITKCKENNIYAIIDWHGIGNPFTNQTRRPEDLVKESEGKIYLHEVNKNLAKKAWINISKRYRSEKHIIFELFNEPAPGNKNLKNISALPWKELKKIHEELILEIRKNSSNLILVSGNKWAMGLEEILKDPILEENIAYTAHPYPIHSEWEELLPKFKEKLPLVITEWAFLENSNQKFWIGTKENYGNKIINICEKQKIPWIAWCFSTVWDPKMLTSWEEEKYTDWGLFIKNELLKN